MIDFAPFFRLAALILATIEQGQKPPANRSDDAVLAKANQYADFINQTAPSVP